MERRFEVIEGGRVVGKIPASTVDYSLEARLRRSYAEHRAAAHEHYRSEYGREPTEEEREHYADSLIAIQFGSELRAALAPDPDEPKGAA
jgi:hypothetical protein